MPWVQPRLKRRRTHTHTHTSKRKRRRICTLMHTRIVRRSSNNITDMVTDTCLHTAPHMDITDTDMHPHMDMDMDTDTDMDTGTGTDMDTRWLGYLDLALAHLTLHLRHMGRSLRRLIARSTLQRAVRHSAWVVGVQVQGLLRVLEWVLA